MKMAEPIVEWFFFSSSTTWIIQKWLLENFNAQSKTVHVAALWIRYTQKMIDIKMIRRIASTENKRQEKKTPFIIITLQSIGTISEHVIPHVSINKNGSNFVM